MAIVPIVEVKFKGKEIQEIPSILNTKCEAVNEITPEITDLIKDLLETVELPENAAAGLSAPQIGINKRVCVVRKFRPDPSDPENEENEIATSVVLINPEVTSESPATDVRWEGCLSLPGKFGLVQRAKRVKVKALNEKGEPIKIKAKGFFARVIQHEIDHLNGILYTDKIIGKILTEPELDKFIEEEHMGM